MKQHHPDWVVTFLDEVASGRALYSADEPARAANSFSYIVEIGASNEMVLIACDWKDESPFPKSVT